MTRAVSRLGTRLPASGEETGTSLVLVLLIVTVIGLAAGATLSLETTSVKTTVAVRDQAASAYAADGAAQVAISKLELSRFPSNCATATAVALGTSGTPFYTSPTPSTAAALNAYVSCSPDAANGVGNPTVGNASTGNALLTLGTGTGGENGIEITSATGPMKVGGGVFSNSTIDVNSGGLQNTFNNPPALPYNVARGVCSTPTLVTPTANTTCGLGATTPDARGTDPGTLTPHGATYDQPAAPTANGTVGACTGGLNYQTLTPGRYTSAAALNGLTGCSTKIVIFAHGTYFFDFRDTGRGSTHVWTVDDTYVVAGTPAPTFSLTTTPTPAQMPTACVAPADAAATTSSGVRFVFGGDSQLAETHTGAQVGGQVTICASKSANGPPIAISGVKTAVTGTYAVDAQSGCITNPPPQTQQCGLIYTDTSPQTTLTIQGTTYLPQAGVVLTLNSSTNQVFRWGLIVRALLIFTTTAASPNLSLNVIDVPDAAASTAAVPDVMYLSVNVCPGTVTCTATGPNQGILRLRAKVRLDTATPRNATVLSWSVQR